jgi:hypothetical protein
MMSPDPDQYFDEKIAGLLRQDAPPARDPMFRLNVLERRERERFQLRTRLMVAGGLLVAVIALVGVSMGGDVAQTTIALLVLAALASGYVLYRPAVTRLLQRIGF